LVMVLSGCGGDAGGASDGDREAASDNGPVAYQDPAQAVADHLGLTRESFPDVGGKEYAYTTPDGVTCMVPVILISKSDIQTYVDAGSAVATNPDRTLGVANFKPKKKCYDALTEALSDL